MRKRRAGALAALALMLWSSTARAAAISAIRSAVEGDSTRIIIEVTETTPYRWGMAPADSAQNLPPRFYVDIEKIRLDPARKLDFVVGDTRVHQVRAAQNDQGRVRVVLDLMGKLEPTVFALQSPPRIVIDLKGKLPAQPVGQTAPRPAQVTAQATPAPPTVAAGAMPARPGPIQSGPKARRVRVVLDPGHGGKDPGARGLGGAVEKNITLDISMRLARKLRDRLGIDVAMTRQRDVYIPLAARKDLANRLDADLFVSIHANAAKNKRMSGIETYYLKNSNNRATLRLASLENGVDMLIGSDVSTDADLDYIVSDLIQGQKEADSIRVAHHLQRSLVGAVSTRYAGVDDLGVKQGPFLVLDGTFMAAVLVETGFVTHGGEAKRLASPSYRETIAEGLYLGIKRYFEDDRTALLR